MKTQLSEDQDPIFNEAAGTKTAVTASAPIITPPAGCKFVRVITDVAILVNTANAAATDGSSGGGAYIVAGVAEIIPVTPGVTVNALSTSGTANVRCTPLKSRNP